MGAATTSSFEVGGLAGWVVIVLVLVVIVVGLRAIWFARAPRLGQASPEQAEAYRQGALALGSAPSDRIGHLRSGLQRWWRQDYRDARRFG